MKRSGRSGFRSTRGMRGKRTFRRRKCTTSSVLYGQSTTLVSATLNQQCAGFHSEDPAGGYVWWDSKTGIKTPSNEQMQCVHSQLTPQFAQLTEFEYQRALHKEAKIISVEYQFFKDALPSTIGSVAGAHYYQGWNDSHSKVYPNAVFALTEPSVAVGSSGTIVHKEQQWIANCSGKRINTLTGRKMKFKMGANIMKVSEYLTQTGDVSTSVPLRAKFPWVNAGMDPNTYPGIENLDVYLPTVVATPLLGTVNNSIGEIANRERMLISDKFHWQCREIVKWAVRGRNIDPALQIPAPPIVLP